MLGAGRACATPTVLLETEWVLRRTYGLRPTEIVLGLRGLLGLSEFEFAAADSVALALDWYEQGMDFADALHLSSARYCAGLATFDRDFIRTAARIGAGRVAEP